MKQDTSDRHNGEGSKNQDIGVHSLKLSEVDLKGRDIVLDV